MPKPHPNLYGDTATIARVANGYVVTGTTSGHRGQVQLVFAELDDALAAVAYSMEHDTLAVGERWRVERFKGGRP